jgi:CNT family concentrative nucleoside transporter
MHLVSILGLVVLLGIAWAMSYHRREVNIRPVLWGVGLQFVLASSSSVRMCGALSG